MNSEPGSQSGPGNYCDADEMAPFLLVTKSSPGGGGGAQKTLPRKYTPGTPTTNKPQTNRSKNQ